MVGITAWIAFLGAAAHSAPVGAIAQDNPAASPTPPQVSRQPTSQDLWTHWPDPPPSALVVLPLVDQSGLGGSLNYEIRESSGRLIQALLTLGGRPATCPDAESLYAALSRRGYSFDFMEPLDAAELAALGRDLHTDTILQVVIRRVGAEIQAIATAADAKTGREIGTWKAQIPGNAPTYEALFDAQTQLAPLVAAGLLGLENPEALCKGQDVNAKNDKTRSAANALAAQARTQLMPPPSYPRILRALRLAQAAVEKDPHCEDAWAALSFGFRQLEIKMEESESPLMREAALRSYVAGEIAWFLAPETPQSHLARGWGKVATGRFAQAHRQAKEALKKDPENWGARIIRAHTYPRAGDDPTSPTPSDSLAREWMEITKPYIIIQYPSDLLTRYGQWVKEEPFSPYLCVSLGEMKDLDEKRTAHTLAAVQGSYFALVEMARQYELAGKPDETKRIAALIKRNTGIATGPSSALPVSAAPSSGPPSSPIADSVEEALVRKSAQGLQGFVAQSYWWEPDCPARNALDLLHKEKIRFGESFATPTQCLRAAGAGGMQFTPRQWMHLAERPALDGAWMSMMDYGFSLGIQDRADELAEMLDGLFPDDLPTLGNLDYYYRNIRRNARQYDGKFSDRMYSLHKDYIPCYRINVDAAQLTPEKKVLYLEKLKCLAPFDVSTLRFIASQLEMMGDWKRAAEYQDLIGWRRPNAWENRINALSLRAMAERRLITAQEMAAMEEDIPKTEANRARLLARLFCLGLDYGKSLQYYQTYFSTIHPTSSEPYFDAAWLYRIQGKREEARQIFEQFIRTVPDQLITCEALLELRNMAQEESDMAAARGYLQRAADIDDWKSSVIQAEAFQYWLEGDRDSALDELRRCENRYPGSGYSVDVGWVLYAEGDYEGAKKQVEKEKDLAPRNPKIYWLQSTLLRREGKMTEAEQVLMASLAQDSRNLAARDNLAWHYWLAGDLDKGRKTVEEAAPIPRVRSYYGLYLSYARICISQNDLAKAEEIAALLLACEPVSVGSDVLRARIALARGDPQKALQELNRALLARNWGGLVVGAQAKLALGDAATAREWVHLANTYDYVPSAESMMIEGDANAALGRLDDAKKLWARALEQEGPYTTVGKQAKQKLAAFKLEK